ncbi:hypothetical protein Tco_0873522 [Tanacetum coccineum]|uniref:Uncharacterized protein n=1 Tax=Tanacetum coccineum TaxID=301880 RepID=A0ABQ5BJF6_9ASTR
MQQDCTFQMQVQCTAQLIRIQDAIKIDSEIAQEMYDKMIYVIQARDDVVEASKIIQDNLGLADEHQRAVKGLAECKASASNLRHIQVKDIVKEVKDELKTCSSAGIDISCLAKYEVGKSTEQLAELFTKVLDQLLLPSHLSAILAVRILIDIDSSSELLKGLHSQDLLDHFQLKTKDCEINLCAPIYLYTFPILEKLNGSSALAWSIVQDEPLLKVLEVGPHFELRETGILGRVTFYGLDHGTVDLSRSQRSYKWSQVLLVNYFQEPLKWYKANFDAPAGNEPLDVSRSFPTREMSRGLWRTNPTSVYVDSMLPIHKLKANIKMDNNPNKDLRWLSNRDVTRVSVSNSSNRDVWILLQHAAGVFGYCCNLQQGVFGYYCNLQQGCLDTAVTCRQGCLDIAATYSRGNLALYDHEGWNDSKDHIKQVKGVAVSPNASKTHNLQLLELEDQINFLLKGPQRTPKTSSTHKTYAKAVSSSPLPRDHNEPPRQSYFTFRERVRPNPQPQALETSFEARVRDYMAAHTERIERFENTISKQREEINDGMAEMFGLLKELTTSRTLVKVLIREEARHPVTKNVNSISLIRMEEEKNGENNGPIDKSIMELGKSDKEEPP